MKMEENFSGKNYIVITSIFPCIALTKSQHVTPFPGNSHKYSYNFLFKQAYILILQVVYHQI